MNQVAGIDAGLFAGLRLLDDDSGNFAGYGPDGVATLMLAIEQGFTVTYTWATDVITHRDGTEQANASLIRPKQTYKGSAKLVGNQSRAARARIARYAAQGAVFLLGLRHEALPLIADASGGTVYVGASAIALSDWIGIGQRVVVYSLSLDQSVDGVIQALGTSSFDLDVAPGTIGNEGCLVMPAMAVYLEAQQDFDRYKTAVETWKLAARAAIFDFVPPRATLAAGTVTTATALAGVTFVSRLAGVNGNIVGVTFQEDASYAAAGAIAESTIFGLHTVVIQFRGGTTTMADIAALFNLSSYAQMTGAYTGADILPAGTSAEFAAFLAGGSALGPMGNGASLTMYDGHPVWDRRLLNSGTITDPSHGQTELVDLGGVPVSLGHAKEPIWGRAMAASADSPAERQWLKLFLATARGMQRFFWLPTWRGDLTFVSATGASLVVRTDDGSDIAAWWPAQRDRLQLRHADETVEYAKITARVDHGDGTQTLTLASSVADTDIKQISWLEAARFSGNSFDVTYKGTTATAPTSAQAFAPTAAELADVDTVTGTTFDEDEKSPRSNVASEYYDIALSTGVTYRIAAGERDVQIGGVLYTATPAARSSIAISKIDGNAGANLELSLPVDHPFVKRCFQYGVPPQQTKVTAWRRQERSQVSEQLWVGLVTSISCEGNVAKLLVPARIIETAQRFLPTVTTAPTCPYILYDAMCQVDRTLFVVSPVAAVVAGRDVTVDMALTVGDLSRVGNSWALGGEMVHVATGERRTVAIQTDVDPTTSSVTKLTMTEVIPELKTGDAVVVYAGCDHTIQTCKNKFAQHHRFGGYPDAALVNPFMVGSTGLQGT